jgi:hypothetical protein
MKRTEFEVNPENLEKIVQKKVNEAYEMGYKAGVERGKKDKVSEIINCLGLYDTFEALEEDD